MARLIYQMLVSLDGFISRPDGSLDWHVISEEWHRFVNEETEAAGALVFGRRMWQVLAEYWPYAEDDKSVPPYIADYSRIWKAKPKFVCSTSMQGDPGWNTRVIRSVDDVRSLKEETLGDMFVGGAAIGESMARADLIDEYAVHLQPVAIGTGVRYWPEAGSKDLELLENRLFDSGVVLLRYGRIAPPE